MYRYKSAADGCCRCFAWSVPIPGYGLLWLTCWLSQHISPSLALPRKIWGLDCSVFVAAQAGVAYPHFYDCTCTLVFEGSEEYHREVASFFARTGGQDKHQRKNQRVH